MNIAFCRCDLMQVSGKEKSLHSLDGKHGKKTTVHHIVTVWCKTSFAFPINMVQSVSFCSCCYRRIMLTYICTCMYASLALYRRLKIMIKSIATYKHHTCLTVDDKDTNLIDLASTDKHKLPITSHSEWLCEIGITPVHSS